MLAENKALVGVPLGLFVLESFVGCAPLLPDISQELQTPRPTVICGQEGGISPNCSVIILPPTETPTPFATPTPFFTPTPEGLTGMEAINPAMDRGENPEHPAGFIEGLFPTVQ